MKRKKITKEMVEEVQPHLTAAVRSLVDFWNALGSIEAIIGVQIEKDDMDHLAVMAPIDGEEAPPVDAKETRAIIRSCFDQNRKR